MMTRVLLVTFGFQGTGFAAIPVSSAPAPLSPRTDARDLPRAFGPEPASLAGSPTLPVSTLPLDSPESFSGTGSSGSPSAQSHAFFGPEDFVRTAAGSSTSFDRAFRAPAYLSAPFTLDLTNGDPGWSGHGHVPGAAVASAFVDGTRVLQIDDRTATAEKTLTLAAGAHTLRISLTGSAGVHLRAVLSGRVTVSDLRKPRAAHTATVMSDGGILVAGGDGATGALASAETFDPVTLASTSLASTLGTSRAAHSATLLPDTRTVLIGGSGPLGTAEVYAPSSRSFVASSAVLQMARSGHTATLLLDGRLLVLGGTDVTGQAATASEAFDARPSALSAGIFDPVQATFTPLPGGLRVARRNHTATLLPSGLVLVVGGRGAQGELASVELLDPTTGQSTLLAAALRAPRADHTATLRSDGTVLIAGGRRGGAILSDLEQYDPAHGTFSVPLSSLQVARAVHAAALLPSGEVLISGGQGSSGILKSNELVGPAPADSVPPRVVATSPVDSTVGIDLGTVIGIRFSEPVDVRTINTSTVKVTSSGITVPGVVSAGESGLYAFFVPLTPLKAGVTYQVTVGVDCSHDEHGGDDHSRKVSDASSSKGNSDGSDHADHGDDPCDGHDHDGGYEHDGDDHDDCHPCPAILDLAGNPLAVTTFRFTTVFKPVITGLVPSHGAVGTTFTIQGSHFDPAGPSANVVTVGGRVATVTAASATTLVVVVPGLPPGPAHVTVQTRGGLAVSPQDFIVDNPVPVLDHVDPDHVGTGGPAVAVVLTGTGFVPASLARLDTTNLTTVYISQTELRASIPASALAHEATFAVTVVNPGPAGGTSNARPFVVQGSNQPPVVSAGPDQTVVLRDNLLDNASGDAPLVGGAIPRWTAVAGAWTPAPAATGDFPPSFEGTTYFAADATPGAELRQDVDASALAPAIDGGNQAFDVSAYVRDSSRSPANRPRLVVEFRDAGNLTVLASADSGAVTTSAYWAHVNLTPVAPAGTRVIRVRLLSAPDGPSGSGDGGYFDALSLRAVATTPTVTASLSGSATDDGAPTGILNVAWSAVNPPGPVTFAHPTAAVTTATFGAPGAYRLRLTATDTQLTASADAVVTVLQQNHAPLVNAGADRTVALPTDSVTLTGSVVDDGLPSGSSLAVTWTQLTGPQAVIFASPQEVATAATFSGPGTYRLRLVATDSDRVSSSDVTVTVSGPNRPPTVEAGPSQSIAASADGAILAGTVSDDGLPAGGTLTSLWTQRGGPGTASFADASDPRSAVHFSTAGLYVLRLTASDTELSAAASTTVLVQGPNQPPVVSAGPNLAIALPDSSVTLFGSATDDGLPAGGTLTTVWSTVAGPGSVTFTSGGQPVTGAQFSVTGTYTLRLTATDTEQSASSDVVVTVSPAGPPNQPPTVSAGPNRSINLPTNSLDLAGSASDDGLPVGGHLSTQWSQTSGPGIVTFADASQPATFATFSAAGTYGLRLTASDSRLTSSADAVVAVVAPHGNLPPIVDAGGDQTVTLATNPNDLPLVPTLVPISTNFNSPIGLAYHPPTNKLMASVNYPSGQPHNFELIAADGSRTTFSTISGLTDEVYIAIARDEGGGMSRGGFAAGEMFTGSGVGGAIVRISPDGTQVQNPWVQLPGETGLLRGQLRLDRTGVFGGDLIVATNAGHVWRVNAAGQPTLLASLGAGEWEGLETVPNDPVRYGPWAGRILVGTEDNTFIYALDGAGHQDVFDLGIAPEGINRIPPNENFYGVDFTGNKVWGIPAAELVGLVGDILIPEEVPGNLWHVRWNGASFETTKIAQVAQWEGTAFAPAGIGQVASTSATVSLNGSVTDDGFPTGATVVTTWSEVAGPGTATFADASAPHTSVILSAPGTYVLRLTGSDSELSATSDAIVTLLANRPPVVDPGPPQEIVAPASASLSGSVSDDGLPAGGDLSSYWTKVIGPGDVSFDAPSFDTAQAFSTTSNPNGAWTYGWTPDRGGAFTPFPAHGIWVGTVPGWFRSDAPQPSPSNFPLVLFNDSGAPSGPLPVKEFLLHPGPLGENSVVRWTAPVAGTYLVQGRFTGLVGTTTDVSVLLNSATVLSGNVFGLGVGVPFTFVRELATGDTLDFSVGNGNGSYNDDSTGLTATITAAGSATSSASFSLPGDYLLRLTGYDSEQFGFGDVAVRVAPTCVATPSGALGWWPGDGDTRDLVGGHTGVVQGPVAFEPGRVGEAFSFDGTDASVVVPASPAFSVGSLTLETWVYPTDLSQQRPILEFATAGRPVGVHVWQSTNAFQATPGALYANLRDTGAGDHLLFTPRGTLVANRWTHVALTYDQATHMARLYANGVVVAVKDVGLFTPQTSLPLNFGLRPAGTTDGGPYFLAGKLDEVGLYDRALSADEILNVYAAGQAGRCKPTGPQPPVVSAGLDQSITLPTDTVTLNGSAVDPDGGPLAVAWSQVNGSGAVTFANPSSPLTTAHFSGPGVFVLRLTASNAQLTSTSDVTVTVNPPQESKNLPPAVDAGPDQTVTLPARTVTLAGTVVDDGLPTPTTTALWSEVSGPGTATFTEATHPSTDVSFDAPGTYVLRLTASDGALSASDDVVVTVAGCDAQKLFLVSRQAGEQPSSNEVFRYDVTSSGAAALGLTIVDPSFDSAGTLSFTPSGEMLVVSSGSIVTGHGLITRFADPTGAATAVGTITSPSFDEPMFGAFRGHELFQAQRFGRNVLRFLFDAAGNATPNGTIDEGLAGPFPGAIEGTVPRGVAIAPNGDVLVSLCCGADQINRYHLDAAGVATLAQTVVGNGLSNPHDMVVSTGGELFVANPGPPQGSDYNGHTVSRFVFDQSGALVANGQIVDANLNGPLGLAFSPWGELFVANLGRPGGIVRFTFDAAHAAVPNGVIATPNTASDIAFSNQCPVDTGNRPPGVNAGGDQTITQPATTATLSGTVADDGLPNGTLVVSWSQVAGPSAVSFADASRRDTTVALGAPGTYALRLTASDGEFVASDDLTIVLQAAANQPPSVSAGPDQTVTVPATTATLTGSVSDDGRPSGIVAVAWSQVAGPAGQVTFTSPGSVVTNAIFGTAGTFILRLTASDGALAATDDVTVVVRSASGNQPPVVNAGPTQILTLPSVAATLNGAASDDGRPAGGTLVLAWTRVSGPGHVTFGSPAAAVTTATVDAPGVYLLRLSASDGELTSTSDVTFVVQGTAPAGAPPAISITSPADGAVVTSRVDVVGSVDSGTLFKWVLEYRRVGDQDFTPFASGTNPVSNAPLATFDPTLLLNGSYEVRLTATDTSTRSTSVSFGAIVRDNQKVGNFTVSFLDLEVPVAGLPIRVTRTYDSRDKGQGDFGIGWRLDLSSLRVAPNANAGEDWTGISTGGPFPSYCLQQTKPHVVTLTFPGGRVQEFQETLSPQCQQFVPIDGATVTYQPRPGSLGTLTPLDDADVFVSSSWPGPADLIGGDGDVFHPTRFQYTAPDGQVFVVDATAGLQSLTDRNGNTLTVSPSGITHSAGTGITFARDARGRITSITDPAGNAMSYAYDAAGDLVSFTDRESSQTTFTYNDTHGLLTIRDPRGKQPIRNEYDDDGRIKSHTDAFGKTIQYTHDLDGRQEIVVDRNGNQRVLVYDVRGNVIQETDALGKIVTRTFDDRTNRLSETLPHDASVTNPPTSVFTYDAQDNVLSMSDPLGQTTRHTYNDRKQVLTATDPRGGVSVNVYDGGGNLVSAQDAAGNVTRYAYDAQGNVLSQTVTVSGVDLVTRHAYDGLGRLTTDTDATGHETTYGYDEDGNRLTQTTSRTGPSGSETLTTAYAYDKQGRVLQTTDADGSTTRTVYDELGHVKESYDKLVHKTAYAYDDMSRLILTTFSDGTTEGLAYDAEGRRTVQTDRGGRSTRYEYDVLGRLKKTSSADGSFTTNEYDAAGRLTSSIDGRGKATIFEYDDAGRRTTLKDPAGNLTTFGYDAAGNQTSSKDAKGQTTTFTYDALNRRVQTRFPDQSFRLTAFDELDRRISEVDQSGRMTHFEYDAVGRLTKVTDARNQVTGFAYDELGNRTSQTDANLHTTTFVYDALSREISRILPGGAFEARTYDPAGNLKTRTDFNGNTTTYAYDANNRLTSRAYDALGQPPVTFRYTPTGQREMATLGTATTSYEYDLRDRLASLTYPDGRKLEYGYDPNGNRTSLKATLGTAVLTTAYTYDDANRLDTVTDPLGRTYHHGYDANSNRVSLTYPNGVATAYTYDTLNRLANLTTIRPATGVNIQSYAFTLGGSGNRTRIAEGDGTIRDYAYDELFRLTSENVTAGGLAQYHKAFTYDSVGNRMSQVTTGHGAMGSPTAPGNLTYTYDARDRLLADATSYSYDANGNRIAKAGDSTYTWDVENRLVKANMVDGTTVETIYDADGNRLRTTTTPAGGSARVVSYLVDTSAPLSQVVAETTGSGALSAYYVRGDDLLTVMRPNGAGWTSRFYHADGVGSIRRLTDDDGLTADGYSYTAFGELLGHTGSDPQPFAFAAEPLDSTMALQYHRARWMDPRLGRFAGPDSINGVAEEPITLHRYLYVAADPLDRVDPTGLSGINWVPSNFDYGDTVHDAITEDFMDTGGPFRIGNRGGSYFFGSLSFKIPGYPQLGRLRPDLIDADPTIKQLWEIKTVNEAAIGEAKLRLYLLVFNWADPDKTHPWSAGTAAQYTPTIPFFPVDTWGTYALVFPPILGVITYKLVNFPATIATLATLAIRSMSAAGAELGEDVGLATTLAAEGGI